MAEMMKDSGNEWIGTVPSKWNIQRIKYVIQQDKNGIRVGPFGSSLKEAILEDDYGEYKVYGQANLIGHDFTLGNNYVNKTDYQRLINYEVKSGDILLSMMGTIGKCSVVPENIQTGIMDSHLIKIHLSDRILGKYFEYVYEHSGLVYEQLLVNSNGTTMNGLNSTIIKNVMIPVPPTDEQQIIVDYLDKRCRQIDEVIADLEKQIDILHNYEGALINETIRKGLNDHIILQESGINWIGKIPEHWKISKLGYLGTLQNGISKGAEYFGKGFPFVSYGDVYNNISLPANVTGLIESSKTERSQYSVQNGDVFFTRTSETVEEIGFSSVCEQTIADATFAGFLIRFRPKNNMLSTKFAKYYFRANFLRAYFVKEMMIVTRASLGQYLLKELPVLLPSFEEQNEIGDYLSDKCSEIEQIIAFKQKQLKKIKTTRSSLIYEYVTGKKRVKEVPSDAD